MKKKVTLRRLYHRERWRIAIFFSYDEKLKEVVKAIPGVSYSDTNKCFYVDDTEENLKLILGTIKDVAEADISALIRKDKEPEGTQDSEEQPVNNSGESFPASAANSKKEMQLKRDSGPVPLTYNRSDPDERVFKENRTGATFPGPSLTGNFSPVEFRISERDGLLVVKFTGRYDPAWIGEMKTYGRLVYDKQRREWLLPWAKITADSLADYFSDRGIKVNITRQIVDPALAAERKVKGDEIRGRVLGTPALEGLKVMARYLDGNRYSSKTRESYLAMLEFFFRYFSPADPEEISEEEISRFIYDYIIKLGYSPAYQNQMVSAIKIFYSITGRGRVRPDYLERPRRRRALPKVLSKEEVSRILNSGRNIKHKLILWLIYSCGLRRSEVINLRLSDLDRERNIILIRQGKGGVDRIVPVSQKVWEKADEYIKSYSPREFLFEGQTGRRYSAESVYRVFKDAMERAGIRKDVGVHCLRHSYATHLHESGLDIRYIQELLGHKSTKTTEIYTHVSRRNLAQVRSPIDDLDVK